MSPIRSRSAAKTSSAMESVSGAASRTMRTISLAPAITARSPRVLPISPEFWGSVGVVINLTRFVEGIDVAGTLNNASGRFDSLYVDRFRIAYHMANTATGNEIMGLFSRLHQQGNTIILVTHEHDIAMHAHRILFIRDGKVERDEKVEH